MLIYFLNFQSFFVTLVMAANVLTCNYLGSSSMVAFNFCHRLRLKMSRALTTLPRSSQRVTPMTYQCLQRRAQQSHLKKKRKQKTPRHFLRLLRLCSRMFCVFHGEARPPVASGTQLQGVLQSPGKSPTLLWRSGDCKGFVCVLGPLCCEPPCLVELIGKPSQ